MERLLVLGSGWLGRAAADAGRADGLSVQIADRTAQPDVFDSSSDGARCRAFVRADAVINACGRLQGGDDELDLANHGVAGMMARAAALTGTRLVHLGSAAEYGPPGAELVAEDHPTEPQTAYGRTKLAGSAAVLAQAGSVSVVVARVFNPVGPGQPPHQPIAEFARDARSPNLGPLIVRNADTVRDFVSVHDVGRALVLLSRLDPAGHTVVNVCSGVPVRYGDVARALLRRVGSDRSVRSLDEPVSPRRVVGDPSRLATMTGLRPSGGTEVTAAIALANG